jgi:phosphohistidine phosphatase
MPERTLILLRHAKSDWSGPEDDFDRPLASRGIDQAAEAGRWLAHGTLGDDLKRIDLVVVSPAKRARRTWELASAELEPAPPVRIDERVYAASSSELLAVVRGLPDDASTVILVGHNPGIADLASVLAGESVSMPTSALAVLSLRGSWARAGRSSATLRASGRPPA